MEDKRQTAEEAIRPDFLPEKAKENEAKETLKGAEDGALQENAPDSFLSKVSGKQQGSNKGGTKGFSPKKILATSGASIIILIVLIVAGAALIFAAPIIILGTIDYGLQNSLGFTDTTAILEDQAGHIVAEQLSRGRFNSNYAEDLAEYGIEVGQMTLAGEFIRTNNYLPESRIVATTEEGLNSDSGALSVRFDGKVIEADEFVNNLEANPRLYAAFARGTDISARYYYSQDVEGVYRELGLSRNNFARYKQTGDIEENKKQFEEIFSSAIEKVAKVGLNGFDPNPDEYDDEGNLIYANQSFTFLNDNYKDGEKLAEDIAGKNYDENPEDATRKAVFLLNTAVSANEPYIAAGAFVITEEGLNRARIDGDGPVDPLLNALSEKNSVTITNVETGEDEVVNKSVVGTRNFLAAVQNKNYSTEDARGYSRDRIVNMTDEITDENSRMGIKDSKALGNVVLIEGKEAAQPADSRIVGRAGNSLSTTFYDDVYTTAKSSIGGNWDVMGGSFLSTTINSRVLGAMPSDEGAVARYKKKADEVIARRAEAERATLSPFDITSEHTFLGSLVRKFGNLMVKNLSNSSYAGGYLTTSVAGLFGESVGALVSGVVSAESEESFMTTNGDCPTANNAASVVGDLYCTTHNTNDLSRMDWTRDDYESLLEDSFDDDGQIKEKSPLADFIVYGMGRGTTVGFKDVGICETYNDNLSWWKKLLVKLKNAITSPEGLYNPCDSVPGDIADGSKYTLSGQNPDSELAGVYSSYVLYDTVAALLDEKTSSVAAFKEKYYEAHPPDTSDAGIIARRSGMSKKDAEIALSYNNYLNFIAQYNPSERYAFVVFEFEASKETLIEPIFRDKKMYDELAILGKEIFYRDLRTLATSSA